MEETRLIRAAGDSSFSVILRHQGEMVDQSQATTEPLSDSTLV
jgi:hypothetical protein